MNFCDQSTAEVEDRLLFMPGVGRSAFWLLGGRGLVLRFELNLRLSRLFLPLLRVVLAGLAGFGWIESLCLLVLLILPVSLVAL